MSLAPTSGITNGSHPRVESFFSELEMDGPVSSPTSLNVQAPPLRPPRELRRNASTTEVR
jgi:hypothetical protein